MIEQECPSYPVSIFMAGPVLMAEVVCKDYCEAIGYCVTVTPTQYLYRGGDDNGFIVGLINYPRFPATPEEITAHAFALGDLLREACEQQSYTVQTPERTVWRSWREQ